MSMNDETAEVVYQLQLSFAQNYCIVAAAALVLYDNLLTISQEAELIWARKRTVASTLFALNRWFSIGYAVSMILLIPQWTTSQSCAVVNLLFPGFQLLLSVVWAVFSALRVFAVGHRNFQIASITLVLSLVPVGTNLFSDVRASFTTIDVPGFGIVCNAGSDISATTTIILLIITRSCLVASDTIVLVVTWMNTYRIKKEAVAVNMKASLVTLLLRDGTIYFAVLLVLNVAHLVLSLTSVFLDITFFVTSLSSIIISRFLLNLRQVSSTDDESLDGGPSFVRSSQSTVRFPAFVSSMGAPLDHERHSLTISTLTSTDSLECSCVSNESCAHCVEPEDVPGDCKGDELIHPEEESISRSMDGNSKC